MHEFEKNCNASKNILLKQNRYKHFIFGYESEKPTQVFSSISYFAMNTRIKCIFLEKCISYVRKCHLRSEGENKVFTQLICFGKDANFSISKLCAIFFHRNLNSRNRLKS
jgi:hypothetical protein